MTKYHFSATCILLLLSAAVRAQEFAPAERRITARAGEKVRFGLTGWAEAIEVFTGEEGCDYAYAEKDRLVDPRMILSFESYFTSGKQRDPLRICCSTDFNGNPDEASIRSAKWIDLTRWCTMPDRIEGTDGKGIAPTPSGPVDITSYFPTGGKPLYLCFFYEVEPYDKSTWNSRTQAVVRKFRVDADARGVVRNALLIGRESVHIVRGESYGSDTMVPAYGGKGGDVTIRFTSAFKPVTRRRAYAVTGPIVRSGARNFGPDEPLPIKGRGDVMPRCFEHVYSVPGNYEAVFVVSDDAGHVKQYEVKVKIK